MITQTVIKELAIKYQTTEINIAREYCQHLFLSNFYRQKISDKILFKGGTALKIIFTSPRFSEDLDFSGFDVSLTRIEDLMANVLSLIEKEGIGINILESKKTSGGYLSIIEFRFLGYEMNVQLEVSLRKRNFTKGITALIHNELIPAYTVFHLPEEILVSEKMQALLTRQKPRDFFDLYFILRSHLSIGKEHIRDAKLKTKILDLLQKQKVDFRLELREFLPRSHHQLLKDFNTILKREVERYL